MNYAIARRRVKFVAALLASLALIVSAASVASAVTIGFKSFQVSIDVDLNLTEHTEWNGERSGCFAPYEKWSHDFTVDIDSSPGRKTHPTRARATVQQLVEDGTGTTPSYGAKGSFVQSSSNGSWELTTTNPASCGETPPVPDWATSPTCKKTSERVAATLVESGATGTANGDGILQLYRTPRAKPNPFGKSIGASCYRTLHDLETAFADAEFGITEKSTIIQLPIPDLKEKLTDIGRGGAKSHPKFKVRLRIWSLCNNVNLRPTTAEKPGWVKSPFSQPHQFLGSFNGEPERTKCNLGGSGWLTVRRESKVQRL